MVKEESRTGAADFYCGDTDQKARWYSDAAEAYQLARPKYPTDVIDFAIETAGLVPGSRLLEIGCGPGTATTAFASRNFPMLCIDPNQDLIQLAQRACRDFPSVDFCASSFEDWPLELASFHVVLAASAIHWISAQTAYRKTAAALKDSGSLILLWNMVVQPNDVFNRRLSAVYSARVPTLIRPETDSPETVDAHLAGFGRKIGESNLFTDLRFYSRVVSIRYSTDAYLLLLSTYSQYLVLSAVIRDGLFTEIRQIIDQEFGGWLECTYRSACHVARKA
ncbi:MAG: class I SAM-dependent methyltransferase [Steroidobacteraceae bacterium]